MPIRATLADPERVSGGEVRKNEPRIASVRGCTKSLSQRRTGGCIQWKNIDYTRARCHESQTPQRSAPNWTHRTGENAERDIEEKVTPTNATTALRQSKKHEQEEPKCVAQGRRWQALETEADTRDRQRQADAHRTHNKNYRWWISCWTNQWRQYTIPPTRARATAEYITTVRLAPEQARPVVAQGRRQTDTRHRGRHTGQVPKAGTHATHTAHTRSGQGVGLRVW